MKETEKKRTSYFSPLAARILTAAIGFGFLLCFLITYMGYRHFSKVFRDEYNKMTSQFAYIAVSYLDGKTVLEYEQSHLKDEGYRQLKDKFTELLNIANLESISLTVPDTVTWETQKYIIHVMSPKAAGTQMEYELGWSQSLVQKKKDSIVNIKRLMHLGRLYHEYEFNKTENGLTGRVISAIPVRDEFNNVIAMLSVTKSIDEVLVVQEVYWRRVCLVALIVAAGFFILYGISLWFMVIHPIRTITSETDYFAKNGELSGVLKKIRNKDEIGSLAKSVQKMSNDIHSYISELTSVTREKERITTELNVATKIQSGMLPTAYPAFPERGDFDLFAKMSPAKEVGGDLYDYMMIDDDHLMLVQGDVSGKGVPAALFMVIAKTLIDSHTEQEMSVTEIFNTTNNELCKGNDSGLFVTCWLGILTLSTGELSYVNAGHPYPLLCREGRFVYLKDKPNLVLGAMEDISYTEHKIKLEKGDRLFIYTDGVTEATSDENELFGEERLLEAINQTVNMDAPETIEFVRSQIDRFVNGADQFDDITMLEFIRK